MAESFLLEQKIFDMMVYAYKALEQFPRAEKPALGADIKRCMDTLLARCIEAEKKYFKKTTLQEMDTENAKLQAYIRLAFQLRFLPPKKYEVWSKMLVEIGKMIGGWIQTVKKKSS